MTAIPAKSVMTGPSVTEGGFKTQLDNLLDALFEQAQWCETVGGTADAIMASSDNTPAALVDGLLCAFFASGANASATPTLDFDSLTAKTIVQGANMALIAGDIPGANAAVLCKFNTTLDKWVLLNPAGGRIKVGSFTRDLTLASGNQVVSGVGFPLKGVAFIACVDNTVGMFSVGFDDGAAPVAIADLSSDILNAWLANASRSIALYENGGSIYSVGKVTAVGNDDFTVAWIKAAGSPSGTAIIQYLAWG